MQNDSPKSSVPLPDNGAGGGGNGGPIKQKIPNHILLIPLVVTASIVVLLEIRCSRNTKACPTPVALQVCWKNSFIEFVLR